MPIYSSTLSVESNKFPGVRFTLRKMSEAKRAEFRTATAGIQTRLRALNREAMRMMEQLKDAKDAELDSVTMARIEDLHEEINGLISTEMNPAYVRWGLKYITGLELRDDDQPDTVVEIKTADQLIELGPPELFAEICGAIQAAANMTEDELKNFKLPSISGALMDGNAQTLSAASADSADGSEAEIAPSTSQTK